VLAPVEAALEKATKLNDHRADAFILWAAVKTQTNHADQGLPLALKAVTLDPGDSPTRTTLGHILLILQRKEEAHAQATAALETAKTDAEKGDAQQLLDRLKSSLVPQRHHMIGQRRERRGWQNLGGR